MKKLAKAEVHYRPGSFTRRCANCSMYDDHSCTLVDGSIDPHYVCDRWDVRTQVAKRTIYVIRHGATAMNGESGGPDRIRGWKNLPLSAEGRKEVTELAKKLAKSGIEAIVSSDLERARDTAQVVADTTGATVTLSRRLRPWDLGVFTGQESTAVHPRLVTYATRTPFEPIPNGESFDEFCQRAFGGVKDALDETAGKSLAIVTHHRVERLLKAWIAAGSNPDLRIDMNVMFKPGEATAHAEQIQIAVDNLVLV